MRTMSDTIAHLTALGARPGGPFANFRTPGQPTGRLAALADFGSNPGGLRAHYYRPADLPDGAPLVVVLHGCKQNAGEYDHRAGWSQLADQAGFALLYPEQHHGNNPNLCFNWFRPRDARRGSGEALSIRQMIATMVETHGLDRDRVFVTGLSAGGAMANVMLATYPELLAGGAIIAGLAYGTATTVPEAFDCMRGQGTSSDEELWALLREASAHGGPWPRVAIWQGAADHTVAPSNADDIAAQWRSVHHLGEAPTHEEVSGGRARRIWCNGAGEVVIELNTVAAMGHGTPLGENLGVPGPYMLDVGISSTREIARFWGIEAPQKAAAAPSPTRKNSSPATLAVPAPHTSQQGKRRDTAAPFILSGPSATGVDSVKRVIEQALRAAGLMR
ncbi:poly(hydroxyalkanoate) depolymerase family esterase [Ancylobacter aquaticus]|uniref:Poly(Hydroxyalkanoate) depolymerase family esterase n=1 Tax=Ancylobacter aquaticus TaxID=100 RepID=A0A4V2PK91_ANCAQ|nr:PHB depolymerase family esterase [Ancylobacter aquaticus]TCK31546.1 poly(hydroxyalkanoate) depolymerase family esterase [Ancylobacter aquaticus]